jgi:hypothetical protein
MCKIPFEPAVVKTVTDLGSIAYSLAQPTQASTQCGWLYPDTRKRVIRAYNFDIADDAVCFYS